MESIYTREDLDNAIKHVIDPEVWKYIHRPQALSSAIVEVFVEWDSWECEHETINILRAAEKDLKTNGQFNFLDS